MTLIAENNNQKKVLIIYTGGTLGMMKDHNGSLAPAPGKLEQVLSQMEEFNSNSMPSISLFKFQILKDSSDMNANDWIEILKVVADNYLKYNGFVVIMGTDTMAFAASALSFMAQNLGKPIIFTGSMVPIFEPFNDAKRNLLTSVLIAGNIPIPEVCIFFDSKLIRGNRAKKISSDRMKAFESPNCATLGTLGVGLSIDVLKVPNGEFIPNYNISTDFVTVIKMIPGLDYEFLKVAIGGLTLKGKGLVLELFGSGNMSGQLEDIFHLLKEAQEAGLLIVITSQCFSGRIELGEYAVAHKLKECNVISGHDMTLEAIVTKLAFLIGNGHSTDEIKFKMEQDLAGEITPVRRFSV